MKTTVSLLIVAIGITATAFAAESGPEPLLDPIPEKIQKGNIAVALEEFTRIPQSVDFGNPRQTNTAYARIQYMLPIPDGSGRLVINDLRGLLYVTNESGATPTVLLDVREQAINFDDSMFPNETGLAGFAFHPEFATLGKPGFGKFYTAYSASSDSGVANYLDDDAANHESVIREWTMNDPTADVFSGTSRELFRMGQFDQNHNIGTLSFNYSAAEGSADYGLLYASFGDGGGANDPRERGQSRSEPMSGIFRIDPLDDSGSTAYGIPGDNPFVGESDIAPEIWAYGLRHPQQFSFDSDGTMYIGDIGQAQIEEVNIGIAGANYGWRLREGTFATAFGIGGVRPNPVYPLPVDEQQFTYPVAQFDHDEGNAISSVFVYRGTAIPTLQGKAIFTDMVTGRVFYIDTENLQPGNPATISELRVNFAGYERNVADAVGFPNTYSRGNRADLRLGIDSQGELYFLTKGDGRIRKIIAAP
ncbi:MAG: PQQ-dependent sugar dehydrogenase [Gammaproteobacteria bacterium]|jgi:glucose/arabinose dehydrogenase|nr:PQQ-dependent sugar dehydrogenase [Gammaproteobacteria bacterium]